MSVSRSRWVVIGAVAACLAVLVWTDLRHPRQRTGATARAFTMVDAVSAATKPGASVVGLVASDYERLDAPAPRDAQLSEAQVENQVRYAVALSGGLRNAIPGDAEWVVVKPNIVELKEPGSGVITDWRVVKAVVKLVHEAVPQARVTIAEGGAWAPPERAEVLQGMHGGAGVGDGFAIAGYRQLLADPDLAGIDLDLVDLNFDEAVEVAVPDGGYVFPKYYLPNTVLECDFLISVPVLKIIGAVGMTNALKNFVGVAPGMIYGWPKMSGYPGSGSPGLPHEPGILDEVIVDLVSAAEPDFAVVDAIVGMERAKTDDDDGVPVRLNTVLAGPDLVAVDAVSAQLIGLNPDDLEYLTLAAYRGLGQSDLSSIKIKGSAIEQVGRRFEKYPVKNGMYGEHGHYGQGSRTWLLKGPIPAAQVPTGGEVVDPATPGALPGENGWSQAVYFHDDKLDLDKYFKDPFDCVAYAYCTFTAPEDQQAELWVGSDEGVRVWINGRQVHDFQGRRRHRLPNDRVPVAVRAGENALLVRVDQSRGRYEFSLNLCEPETDPRYDGNRVWGLRFAAPTGEGPGAKTAELAFETLGEGIPADARILPTVEFQPRADMLLAALDVCLRAAGAQKSEVDLVGSTGHAFRLCVADSLGIDGPAHVDLDASADLYANLGYELRHVGAGEGDPAFARRQQEAWQVIQQSIDRGAPAVCRAGGFFWLVTGYHPQKEQCYVAGLRGHADPIEASELGVDEQGTRLDVLSLGAARPVDPVVAARRVLAFAVAEAHRPSEGRYHYGLDGYQHWLAELEAGRVSRGFGVRVVVGAVAERRAQAGPYLRQVASLFPSAAPGLEEAAALYEAEAEVLAQVAALFPLMGRGGGGQGRPDDRRGAAPGQGQAGPPDAGSRAGATPPAVVPVPGQQPAGAPGQEPAGAPASGQRPDGPGGWQSRSAEARRQAVPLIRQAFELEEQAVARLERAVARLPK